ncbi:MAG: hypothetical protein MR981_04965 [Ruminococcus bromii]|nr:hypothetical protein [Ruminococcus bromii]MDD6434104.1 hypothetical protein [Ruminococcus bromii]MDY4085285.1 hypothetical protein [Ruminococcus bromii]MDY4711824.1 hypothetical protein [Ruminococcus bromii]
MKDLIKRYLPYALIIFAVFLIVPLFFANKTLENFFAIALYFIFLVTTVGCSAFYCSKHGLDFLFALISPIAFLFTMLIYCGGFTLTNVILLVVYLVAGIFGLFLGDLAFGDERRRREQKEKKEAEELMLEANRRDASERERMQKSKRRGQEKARTRKNVPETEIGDTVLKERIPAADIDDFDYDKYLADIDKKTSSDDEVDKILEDWHS